VHSVFQPQDSHLSRTVSRRPNQSARSAGFGPVDVVVVDHDPSASDGVRTLLARQSGIRVRGAAESGPETLTLVRELGPEVCLLSTTLGSGAWTRLASHLKQELASIRVLVYSEEQPELVMTALAVISQADGVVWRHDDPDELART
jgi:DNA-binding NarL/FixJ family response regulator